MKDTELSRRNLMKATGSITLLSLAAAEGVQRVQAPDRHGPMRTGRFEVELDDVPVQGFRKVEIPASYTEEGQYREGNDPDYEKKLWGQTTFDDLEVERGVQAGDTVLYDWREHVRTGHLDHGTKELKVTLLDEDGEPEVRWTFHEAWLKKYDPPTLTASADGEVATENASIAFDRMTVQFEFYDLEPEFTVEPENPEALEEIEFDASETTPEKHITEYEWSFGDGTTISGAPPEEDEEDGGGADDSEPDDTGDEDDDGSNIEDIRTPSHSYSEAGGYTVELTVYADEESETESRIVEVGEVERSLEYYADDDMVIREHGVEEATEDWENEFIEKELYLAVVDHWQTGEEVN